MCPAAYWFVCSYDYFTLYMRLRIISLLTMLILLGPVQMSGKTSYENVTFNTDSLLAVLDGIVAGHEPVEESKRIQITESRMRLAHVDGDMDMFDALGEMFMQYRKYRLDSALFYARSRVVVANRLGCPDSIAVAEMNVADGLKGLGKFKEGLAVLEKIPRNEFVKNSNYYYYLLHSITLSIYNEEYDSEMMSYYADKLRCYRDTISKVCIDSTGYVINMGEIYMSRGRHKDALKILTDFKNAHPSFVADNAVFWCTLADVYHATGNREAEKYCLTMGAIIDKRNCVKTYTSLQNLALLLNREGDSERAYRYIVCSMNDIMSSSARSRLLQVADAMPIILEAYTEAQSKEHLMRRYFYIMISVLIVTLVVILAVMYKHNCKLRETRHKLDAKNRELLSLNEKLKDVNNQLGESNKIKETYIAQLFKICTEYIDDMEKYRMLLSRKLKAGQLFEIKALVSQSVVTEAMKEFFKKFDTIFLELFPTFVEDFNKLLKPEFKITPKEKDSLTTELRIYALVRLGINDSTKIASFLHYSSQTVYNYRQKVRSRSIVPKDKFVEAVQNL